MLLSLSMRELHGVTSLTLNDSSILKRQLLLIDTLHITSLPIDVELSSGWLADLAFLRSRGILDELTPEQLNQASVALPPTQIRVGGREFYFSPASQRVSVTVERRRGSRIGSGHVTLREKSVFGDSVIRQLACGIAQSSGVEAVALCTTQLPASLPDGVSAERSRENVIRVALGALPTPDGANSLQDILDFKTELRDKRWDLRRFLRNLANKNQSEADIRDEIEWLVNEYSKAMAIHHIKSSQSFVDVFMVSPLEIIENLVKFNWSRLAKGVVSVRKRKIELLEAEMKSSGRECAYVLRARQRFEK
jgi:hypothetical protein